MSNPDIQSPAPLPAPPQPRRSRVRSVIVGTVLLLTGGVIGAVVASPGYGFGPGWHGGPPGWHQGGHRGMGMGGMGMGGAFFPGQIERMVGYALDSVDASTEQKQKIRSVAERTADDLFAMRERHLAGRKQIGEALAAPTIDRGRIEALRVEQMKLAEDASKRVTQAVAEAAETLTPAQRAELAKRIESRRRWFRG